MSGRSFSQWCGYAIATIAALLIVATLIPLTQTNQWWLRIFTFPQAQIAALLILTGIAAILFLDLRKTLPRIVIAAVVAAVAYQAYHLAPFTALYPREAASAQACPAGDRLRVLVLNVLEDNRRHEPVLELVREQSPDLFLAMETDRRWVDALEPLRAAYPNVVSAPRGGPWGMILFSRLPLGDAEVRYLLDGYVPSIQATVRLPAGAEFDFYGLHPKPPVGRDAAPGDAEVIIAAGEIRDAGSAAIVAGDLNDVPWSATTRLFKAVSGMKDPRIGRGFMASFTTKNPFMRWPLDHILMTPSFEVIEFERLADVGSDHFPVRATLCHREGIDSVPVGDSLPPETRRQAREVIEEGREAADD